MPQMHAAVQPDLHLDPQTRTYPHRLALEQLEHPVSAAHRGRERLSEAGGVIRYSLFVIRWKHGMDGAAGTTKRSRRRYSLLVIGYSGGKIGSTGVME